MFDGRVTGNCHLWNRNLGLTHHLNHAPALSSEVQENIKMEFFGFGLGPCNFVNELSLFAGQV